MIRTNCVVYLMVCEPGQHPHSTIQIHNKHSHAVRPTTDLITNVLSDLLAIVNRNEIYMEIFVFN